MERLKSDIGDKYGPKAENLSILKRNGFPVPNGHVLKAEENLSDVDLDGPFAVRSSSFEEDQSDKSSAGQFETVLNVDKVDLDYAIADCREDGPIPLIIQGMQDFNIGGVLFTNMHGNAILETAEGGPHNVVSGEIRPETITREESSSMLSDTEKNMIFQFGDAIESLFGSPQDIEWGINDGVFWITQSRPIVNG